jgi:hypothetical protein
LKGWQNQAQPDLIDAHWGLGLEQSLQTLFCLDSSCNNFLAAAWSTMSVVDGIVLAAAIKLEHREKRLTLCRRNK